MKVFHLRLKLAILVVGGLNLSCGIPLSSDRRNLVPAETYDRFAALNLSFHSTLGRVKVRGELTECVSGYKYEFTGYGRGIVRLVEGDRNCKIFVTEIDSDGEIYVLDTAHNAVYNHQVGARNRFIGESRSVLFVIPKDEIPSPMISDEFLLSIEIVSLGEGESFRIQMRHADLLPRPGLFGWFAKEGKFTLESGRNVRQWRSLEKGKVSYVQDLKILQPKFDKNSGVRFSGDDFNLHVSSDGPSSDGARSFALSFSMAAKKTKGQLAILGIEGCGGGLRYVLQMDGTSLGFASRDAPKSPVLVLGGISSNVMVTLVGVLTDRKIAFWRDGVYAGGSEFSCDQFGVQSLGAISKSGEIIQKSFEGTISDLVFWNRPLTIEERQLTFEYLSR